MPGLKVRSHQSLDLQELRWVWDKIWAMDNNNNLTNYQYWKFGHGTTGPISLARTQIAFLGLLWLMLISHWSFHVRWRTSLSGPSSFIKDSQSSNRNSCWLVPWCQKNYILTHCPTIPNQLLSQKPPVGQSIPTLRQAPHFHRGCQGEAQWKDTRPRPSQLPSELDPGGRGATMLPRPSLGSQPWPWYGRWGSAIRSSRCVAQTVLVLWKWKMCGTCVLVQRWQDWFAFYGCPNCGHSDSDWRFDILTYLGDISCGYSDWKNQKPVVLSQDGGELVFFYMGDAAQDVADAKERLEKAWKIRADGMEHSTHRGFSGWWHVMLFSNG